jgi:hypothetical protein
VFFQDFWFFFLTNNLKVRLVQKILFILDTEHLPVSGTLFSVRNWTPLYQKSV